MIVTFYRSVPGVVQPGKGPRAPAAREAEPGMVSGGLRPPEPPRSKEIFDFGHFLEGASGVFSDARKAVLGSRKAAFWETCIQLHSVAFCEACVLRTLRSGATKDRGPCKVTKP